MNKKINITEKNIFEGEKANPQNCAIARAIKRNMKSKVMSVSVLPSHVTLKIDNKIFIKRFDKGTAVNPFQLKLKFRKGFKLSS